MVLNKCSVVMHLRVRQSKRTGGFLPAPPEVLFPYISQFLDDITAAEEFSACDPRSMCCVLLYAI